jgi:hypothetical protein
MIWKYKKTKAFANLEADQVLNLCIFLIVLIVFMYGATGCVYVSIEKDHDSTIADNIAETDLETINTETANTKILKETTGDQ